jgi:hypothetical protein
MSLTSSVLGRRTSKVVNGQAENYLYDVSDIIGFTMYLKESGSKNASYTYGTGTDEPLMRNSGSLKEHCHMEESLNVES